MLIKLDIGNKRPSTLPLRISKKELMFKGEFDISIVSATIPPINKVNMLYY